jgi:hypothetical protein
MLMPDYEAEAPDPAAGWNWQAEKANMRLINVRPDPVKRKAEMAAVADTRNRFQMAKEAKARGATPQEIRLILEA